jgi:hypothetical protein
VCLLGLVTAQAVEELLALGVQFLSNKMSSLTSRSPRAIPCMILIIRVAASSVLEFSSLDAINEDSMCC